MSDMSYQRADGSRSSQPVSEAFPLPVTGGAPSSASVIIANLDSLSAAVQIGGRLASIRTPASLAGTYMEIHSAESLAGTYLPVCEDAEPIRYAIAASIVVTLEPRHLDGLRFLKFKTCSDDTGTAQTQSADRTLTLNVQP